FSSRRRHTRSTRDWSSDVCSSDLIDLENAAADDLPFFEILEGVLVELQHLPHHARGFLVGIELQGADGGDLALGLQIFVNQPRLRFPLPGLRLDLGFIRRLVLYVHILFMTSNHASCFP